MLHRGTLTATVHIRVVMRDKSSLRVLYFVFFCVVVVLPRRLPDKVGVRELQVVVQPRFHPLAFWGEAVLHGAKEADGRAPVNVYMEAERTVESR